MYEKYLAIIPARGGSKRLPKKNIMQLLDKPLIAWSIEAALESKYINEVYVSSDSDEILDISREFGSNIIKRPESLATDLSSTYEAVKHAIDNIKKYEYIVLLQATSPLRNFSHIDEAIELFEKKKADAVVSVCEMDHSPLWANTLDASLSMDDFISLDIQNKRSQDLESYYRINGAIYIIKTEKFLERKTFLLNHNIFAYKMKRENSIDIDESIDFIIAKTILEGIGNE